MAQAVRVKDAVNVELWSEHSASYSFLECQEITHMHKQCVPNQGYIPMCYLRT